MLLLSNGSSIAAGNSAFAALIWWVVPLSALIGGIGYVIWVTKFKRKFESETSRSVGNFQRFQDSFRNEAPLAEHQAPEHQAPEHQAPEHQAPEPRDS